MKVHGPTAPRDGARLACGALGVSVIIGFTYLLFRRAGGVPLAVADGLFLLTSAVAGLACLYAATRLGQSGKPWRFFGIGCLSWVVGQGIWDAWIVLTGKPPEFPSIADLGFLGLYLFFFIGLLHIVRSSIDGFPTRELVTDSLIVTVVTGTLLFLFVLEPFLDHENLNMPAVIASILWLIGTFALVFLTSIALFWGATVHRRSLGILLVGLIAFTSANVIYARLAIEERYTAGHLVDLGWHVGFMLVAAAAFVASSGNQMSSRVHSQQQLRRSSLGRSGVLLMSVLSLTGLAAWGALHNEPQPTIAIGVGVVGLLLALRLGYAAMQSDWLDRRTTERDRLERVLRASSTMAGTLDLEHLLPQFAHMAAESVGCTRGEVYFWAEDSSRVDACAYHGFDVEELRILDGTGDVPIGEFEAEREMMKDLEPRIQRVEEDDMPGEFRVAFRAVGKLQTIVGPIVAHGRIMGTFDLWTPHDVRAFQEADLSAVRAIDQQAGLAVHNARLLEASRRHATEQQALLRVSQAAISQLDLRSVLAVIASASLGIANAESCAIELWHPESDDTEMLAQAYADDWAGPMSVGTRYPLDTWPSSRSVVSDQITINVLTTDSNLGDTERSTFLAAGTQALLVVPLILRGDSLGILTLFSRQQRLFTTGEVRLARELAAQVSLAIERARLREALLERADTDGLTELLNHRAILEVFDHELARARRSSSTVGVMMIDLDGFKNVNDTHGHQTGDQVLRDLAEVLRSTFREIDRIGRYGGDEFLVVLPQISADDVDAIISRLDTRATDEFHRGAATLPIKLSVGAAIYPDDGHRRDDLIITADSRMYAAKGIHRLNAPVQTSLRT